jgi:hypothetical protein
VALAPLALMAAMGNRAAQTEFYFAWHAG